MPTFLNVNAGPAETHWAEAVKWIIQTVSGVFLLGTFLLTYRHNVRVRASDLLLKLEEHFNALGSKLCFLEYKKTCYDPIKGIFTRFCDNPDDLSEAERHTLADIDECIRFLYICSLHAGNRIARRGKSRWYDFVHSSRIPHAYYYYLNIMNDKDHRPELYAYVRRYFPILSRWLETNKDGLAYAFSPAATKPSVTSTATK